MFYIFKNKKLIYRSFFLKETKKLLLNTTSKHNPTIFSKRMNQVKSEMVQSGQFVSI